MLKDHNAVTSVRLEPAASRSLVKHSTTEPLRSCIRRMDSKLHEDKLTCLEGVGMVHLHLKLENLLHLLDLVLLSFF